MAKRSASALFAMIDGIEDRQEKIRVLRERQDPIIIDLLRLAYDPSIRFDLPDGPTPYGNNLPFGQEGQLYSELGRIRRLFLVGSNPNLKQGRRQTLWIQTLESIAKDDAVLLDAIKDKGLPYPTITYDLVAEAFPGLLPEYDVLTVDEDKAVTEITLTVDSGGKFVGDLKVEVPKKTKVKKNEKAAAAPVA